MSSLVRRIVHEVDLSALRLLSEWLASRRAVVGPTRPLNHVSVPSLRVAWKDEPFWLARSLKA
jgi:hypothetical protein